MFKLTRSACYSFECLHVDTNSKYYEKEEADPMSSLHKLHRSFIGNTIILQQKVSYNTRAMSASVDDDDPQAVAALFFKKQDEYIGTKPEIKLGNLYDFSKPTGVMYMSFGIFNCNLESTT